MTPKRSRSIDAHEALKKAMEEGERQYQSIGDAAKKDPRKGIDFLQGIERRSDWQDACRKTGLDRDDWKQLKDSMPRRWEDRSLEQREIARKLDILASDSGVDRHV